MRKLDRNICVTTPVLVVTKEGCNRGHGLAAAIKLESLEKTVGALSLHSGVYYSSPFFVEKTALLNILPS